ITVFEGGSHEWRLFVCHVVHAQRDRHIVEHRSPSARIIFGGGDRHHVLVLASHLHVLAAILGISRHFGLGRWRWQVEGVVEDQIQRHPFTNLAILRSVAGEERIGGILRDRSMVGRYRTAWRRASWAWPTTSWVCCPAKKQEIKLAAIPHIGIRWEPRARPQINEGERCVVPILP